MIDWLRDSHINPKIDLDGRVLPIEIRRHKQAKRLTMRMAPDGSALKVTMPTWGRTKDALEFAELRREWILVQLERVPQTHTIEPGAPLPFRGKELEIDWQADAPRKGQLEEERLHIGGPQDRLEARLQNWLEKEALELLAHDLAHYCERANKPLPQLRLSRAKRRWGSCADSKAKGQTIRINWRLIMAPDNVRRSVVAHEVAHLSIFDHSPAFHAHLGELFDGDLPAADLWLKAKGRSLYTRFV